MSSLTPPLPQGAARVASSYAKRWADQNLWDAFMRTGRGKRLMSLSRSQKFGAEAVFYLLDAVVWHKIDGNTPTRIFASEVLGDAAPEIAKRMLNGTGSHTPDVPPTTRTGLYAMMDLPEETRGRIMTWYREQPTDKRRFLAGLCRAWSVVELTEFADTADKDDVLDLAGYRPAGRKTAAIVGGINSITARLNRLAGKK